MGYEEQKRIAHEILVAWLEQQDSVQNSDWRSLSIKAVLLAVGMESTPPWLWVEGVIIYRSTVVDQMGIDPCIILFYDNNRGWDPWAESIDMSRLCEKNKCGSARWFPFCFANTMISSLWDVCLNCLVDCSIARINNFLCN
jgi:hypothetical protein